MRFPKRNRFVQKGIFFIPISPFVSDILKLVGGTTVSQALTIIASPAITRFYGPEAFGVAALFATITSIIAVVACLRYELAIMLPKKDEDAANLLGLSLLLLAAMSALLLPMLWLGQESILGLLNAQKLRPYIWLIPPAVFLIGASMALNYWNSRTRRFGLISVAGMNASVSTTGAQVVAGLAGFPTGGSIIGAGILGSAVSTLVLGGKIWQNDRKLLWDSICSDGMLEGLMRHKKFPIFDSWSALLNSLSSNLPVLLLSSFFTTTVVGYYALGYRVLALPMSFIGSSIGQVFFQRAAKARSEGSLGELVEKSVQKLIIISFFPFLLLFLFGEELFTIIFGIHWAEAGVYAEILVPWVFIVFVSSPISTLFSVLEKQRISLLINIMLVVFRGGALILGGILGNAIVALILFAIVGSIMNVIALFWLMNKSGASVKRLSMSIMNSLAYCIPLFFIAFLVKLLQVSPVYILIVCTIAAIIYYMIISKDIIRTIVSQIN